jgi:protein SCO1/2
MACGLMCLAMLGLVACEPKPQQPVTSFKSTDITGIPYAQTFSLTDAAGQKRSLADFKGKVVVVFFGFTQCPDVCPTTLAELVEVKKALGPDAERLQPIFITIDPERDTPEVLRAYVTSFDPGFIALRGSLQETSAVAKEFKVYFAKVPGKTPESYTMDHSSASYVFDPEGRPRLLVRNGGGVAAWLADIQTLLAKPPR